MSRIVPAGLLLLLVTAVGCTRTTKPTTQDTGRAVADPWPAAVSALCKESDLSAARRVLSQLNAELPLVAGADVPAGLTPAEEAALVAVLPLSDDELKEVRGPAYTSLDPNYVAECLYLRDAAKSLGVTGVPPRKQAAAAFAWVCRQVYVHPWLVPSAGGAAEAPPLPPTFVLRRGHGSGLERAYVFLALLQQLGLDGCLIGPDGAEAKPWHHGAEAGRRKGPFWAVGARVGGDVLLFEPWRGEAFPGTLAQLRANPDALKPWFEDKARPWDVTPADVKAAEVFLAVPLSGVAPRMRRLDEKLAGDPKVATDPVALRDRFLKEAMAPRVRFWHPKGEQSGFTFTTVLGDFLPLEEGGNDRRPAGSGRLYDVFRIGLFPRSVIRPTVQLDSADAANQLAGMGAGVFDAAFFGPQSVRERIHRGQFNEATQQLVEKEKAFSATRDRGRDDAKQAAAEAKWVAEVDQAYKKRSLALLNRDPVAVAEAEAAVDALWKQQGSPVGMLVERAVAEPGLAEAAYLLAVCKHELAERTQLRFDTAAGKGRDAVRSRTAEAWGVARDSWDRYKPFAAGQDASYPGRAAHAATLADRAARLAANPASE